MCVRRPPITIAKPVHPGRFALHYSCILVVTLGWAPVVKLLRFFWGGFFFSERGGIVVGAPPAVFLSPHQPHTTLSTCLHYGMRHPTTSITITTIISFSVKMTQ